MKITFLGTGTSQGIPVIACDCAVCRSSDFRDKRLRTSIWIQIDDKSFVIDTGPDFRQQMLRADVRKLDAAIFTHPHKDHTAGLDDIRAYNHLQKKDMPIYGRESTLNQLKTEFAYAFSAYRYPGVPQFETHLIENEPLEIEGVKFIPIDVLHHKMPVFGFRIGDFTYITDVNYISEIEQEKIKGSRVLVIDTLQKEQHLSHYNLSQALDMIDKLNVPQNYLIHMSHKLGLHESVEKELPAHVRLSYDGLVLEV